jgi:hypothetical protein
MMLLKVTAMSDDFADGFINLGALYVRTGENDKVIAALDHAVSILKRPPRISIRGRRCR